MHKTIGKEEEGGVRVPTGSERWMSVSAAHWQFAAVAALGVAVATGLTGASAPVASTRGAPVAHSTQGGPAGRYVLRSVNGLPLPATIPGDDPRHTIQITEGVLELNPNGTYLCRTEAATSTRLGLREPFADSLHGGYTILQSGAIQLGLKGARADTIVTSGFQIVWSHALRTAKARFLYSR
jgi:hypothetical protein